jgi:hypothetical protein
VPVSLLPDLAAALPVRTYFFRDFTVTFLPLRLFAARELREGRIPFWNPCLFEGSFQLPVLYPPDLLHALWPSPAFVSWLLSLHLPLAGLGAYWLARELGATRVGGFVSGAVYALCGFTLSCLNLYVFLQALALAPFVAGLLRRAAVEGGRRRALAACVLALAVTTLALEFVAQAVLVGAALGVAAAGRRALPRLALAVALGLALAAVPVAVVAALLPETSRGAGFSTDVALANAVHPAVLLQSVLPHLFGDPAAPAEAWWGGRFFSKGLPYFLSLYLGPTPLALAALATRGRARLALLASGGLGLWYALGAMGGLATLAMHVPFGPSFRFPSKALLLPHLAVATLAGLGTDRLLSSSRPFARLAAWAGAVAALALGVAFLLESAPAGLVAWSGVRPSEWPLVTGTAWRDALSASVVAGAVLALALGVLGGRLSRPTAVGLLAALTAADLARAGTGLNRQVAPSLLDLLPETASALRGRQGGRVFSYGLDHSPAFRAFLASGRAQVTLGGFLLHRQLLGPYTNVLDGVESPEASDLTAFAPRARELDGGLYDPARVADLVPWLRNAAVSRILSLDRLEHPALTLLAEVPTGLRGSPVLVYALEGWPRAYVACHVVEEPVEGRAIVRPYEADFDPGGDVALAGAAPATCTVGSARRGPARADREVYDVAADGEGYLVVRASYARGWRARVDGVPAPVLAANGKHRAVRVPAGEHRVETWYQPPGLRAGLWLTVFAGAVAVALARAHGPSR